MTSLLWDGNDGNQEGMFADPVSNIEEIFHFFIVIGKKRVEVKIKLKAKCQHTGRNRDTDRQDQYVPMKSVQ